MSSAMKLADKGRKDMANGADMPRVRRGARTGRTEALSELPMVAALLVAAVLIALVAAGGPVLDMLSNVAWTS